MLKDEQTLVIGVRIKPMTLATIARFLREDLNEPVNSPGGIIRLCAEIFEAHTECRKFGSNTDAIRWLESSGILSAERTSQINKEKIVKTLQLDVLRTERTLEDDIREAKKRFAMMNDRDVIRVDFDNLNPPEEGSGEIITLLPKG